MLLLVTGASGVGKTTVRKLIGPQLQPEVYASELAGFAASPPAPTLRWRQQTAETAVQYGVRLQHEGRHLLLCGDPVAAVEVAATPSVTHLDAVAFCLLDATPQAQSSRLAARGDDPSLLVHHHAFATWMREQVTDPLHMLQVVSVGGWDLMRWGRIPDLLPQWYVHTIDTTSRDPDAVAAHVLKWIRAALAQQVPLMRPALAGGSSQ